MASRFLPFHPRTLIKISSKKKWLAGIRCGSIWDQNISFRRFGLSPETKELKIDISLLPVSGTYVMTADQAVKAALALKPERAIPMHHGAIIIGGYWVFGRKRDNVSRETLSLF